jgi:hypothetical protein
MALPWFERNLKFGHPPEMLPFFLERLEGTIVRLEQKVNRIDNNILSEKLNGKWSIKETIGHLAEVDQIGNRRMDEMISGTPILSPAVFEPRNYNPWPIEEVLDHFRQSRKSNLKKYRTLSGSDLKRTSLHPRLKLPMTPVDLAWFDAEHDDHHLVRINEIIQSLIK